MSRLAVVLFMAAATGASGCRSLVQCKENESLFAPAILEDQTIADATAELNPAKTGFAIQKEGEKERPPFSPLVSKSFAQPVPGDLGGEKGDDQKIDSWLICPDSRHAWTALAWN